MSILNMSGQNHWFDIIPLNRVNLGIEGCGLLINPRVRTTSLKRNNIPAPNVSVIRMFHCTTFDVYLISSQDNIDGFSYGSHTDNMQLYSWSFWGLSMLTISEKSQKFSIIILLYFITNCHTCKVLDCVGWSWYQMQWTQERKGSTKAGE